MHLCSSDGGRARVCVCALFFDFIVGLGQSAGPLLTIHIPAPTYKTTAVGPHTSLQTTGRRVEGFGISITRL